VGFASPQTPFRTLTPVITGLFVSDHGIRKFSLFNAVLAVNAPTFRCAVRNEVERGRLNENELLSQEWYDYTFISCNVSSPFLIPGAHTGEASHGHQLFWKFWTIGVCQRRQSQRNVPTFRIPRTCQTTVSPVARAAGRQYKMDTPRSPDAKYHHQQLQPLQTLFSNIRLLVLWH
jgi:hypothetical protein